MISLFFFLRHKRWLQMGKKSVRLYTTVPACVMAMATLEDKMFAVASLGKYIVQWMRDRRRRNSSVALSYCLFCQPAWSSTDTQDEDNENVKTLYTTSIDWCIMILPSLSLFFSLLFSLHPSSHFIVIHYFQFYALTVFVYVLFGHEPANNNDTALAYTIHTYIRFQNVSALQRWKIDDTTNIQYWVCASIRLIWFQITDYYIICCVRVHAFFPNDFRLQCTSAPLITIIIIQSGDNDRMIRNSDTCRNRFLSVSRHTQEISSHQHYRVLRLTKVKPENVASIAMEHYTLTQSSHYFVRFSLDSLHIFMEYECSWCDLLGGLMYVLHLNLCFRFQCFHWHFGQCRPIFWWSNTQILCHLKINIMIAVQTPFKTERKWGLFSPHRWPKYCSFASNAPCFYYLFNISNHGIFMNTYVKYNRKDYIST